MQQKRVVMPILEASEALDLGVHLCSDGTYFEITAVAYVPRPAGAPWRYLVLACSTEGLQRGFECLVPQNSGLVWDDADFALATEVFHRIRCLLDGNEDQSPVISAVAGGYALAEIKGPRPRYLEGINSLRWMTQPVPSN